MTADDSYQSISDWLSDSALDDIELDALFLSFCQRLRDAGLPLARGHLAARALHPMFVASTVTWYRDGAPERDLIAAEDDNGEDWQLSPLAALLESGDDCARHRLAGNGGWRRFPLLVALAARGCSDYFAQLIMFGSLDRAMQRQDGCILSWACDSPDGFSDEQLATLYRFGRRFGVIAKLDRRERTADNIVSAYLGSEAGRRVLDGQIRLGDGERIRTALWYCDMRGSTALIERLSAELFLDLLHRYFRCTAGAVLAHGGEVLHFIGDAVLALFPVAAAGDVAAARAALAAARDAERRLDALNDARAAGEPELSFGLSLHLGEVLFGNLGVPERINFSVLGPAVNETARLEGLTKTLGCRVVVSDVFAACLPLGWRALGSHRIDGVGRALPLYAPPAADDDPGAR